MSLKQRVEVFNHNNPGHALTIYELRKIYRDRGIRKKVITRRKEARVGINKYNVMVSDFLS